MQNFSFFEVPEKEAINVVKALSRAKWNGRKVVVEVSSEEGGKGHENGSSERKGGKRFGKGEDRTPRYDHKESVTECSALKHLCQTDILRWDQHISPTSLISLDRWVQIKIRQKRKTESCRTRLFGCSRSKKERRLAGIL